MTFYSEDQIVAINLLRNNLKDLNLDEYKNSSEYLIRWLKDKDMNIPKAENMLRKSLKWREEENIDSILSWSPPVEIQKFPQLKLCGYNNEGYPVILTSFSLSDIDVFWACDLSLRMRFVAYKCEQMDAILRASLKNNKKYQFVNIIDVSGIEFHKFITPRVLKHLKRSTKLELENYPEMCTMAYITYAPRIFATFFSMVAKFIPGKEMKKIKIYGDNLEIWKHEILMNIPIDVLPIKYGGTNNLL